MIRHRCSKLYTVTDCLFFSFALGSDREGCTLRCVHWKIACLPRNTVWLSNYNYCIYSPKNENTLSNESTKISIFPQLFGDGI